MLKPDKQKYVCGVVNFAKTDEIEIIVSNFNGKKTARICSKHIRGRSFVYIKFQIIIQSQTHAHGTKSNMKTQTQMKNESVQAKCQSA